MKAVSFFIFARAITHTSPLASGKWNLVHADGETRGRVQQVSSHETELYSSISSHPSAFSPKTLLMGKFWCCSITINGLLL